MDGHLGPYDAVEVRLRRADTVILLGFSLGRGAWRVILRSRERTDFWRWLFAYGTRSRHLLMQAIADHAPKAVLHVFRPDSSASGVTTGGANRCREIDNLRNCGVRLH